MNAAAAVPSLPRASGFLTGGYPLPAPPPAMLRVLPLRRAIAPGLFALAAALPAAAQPLATPPPDLGIAAAVADSLGLYADAALAQGDVAWEAAERDAEASLAGVRYADTLDAALVLGEDAASVVPADTSVSPLDTLRMSAWERVWWGRRGLMRVTGLFPTHPEAPVEDFRQIAHVRRRMLSLHQLAGLATVASMAVTVYGGQRAIDGHGSGLHEASLPVTIGLYSATATLALLSPPRLLNRRGFDTMTIHRALAVLHISGMIITPLLAPDGEDGDGARVHQAMGYATLGTLAAAMLVTFLR